MLKSATGCESSSSSSIPSSIVSSSHIGRRVVVDGVGEGTLRYVGGISGKSGLFCGIELDEPTGKHDGTFQDFSYFSCLPLHGIFAPLYKVVLVDLPSNGPSALPQSKTFLLQQQEQQRLSRSALPSLQIRSVYPPSPSPSHSSPAHSAMETSQSSMSSSLLNQSYVMNGSWQWGDDMMASNNTYILPSRSFEEEDDLMAVQTRDSILDRVLTEMPIGTSLILEESRVGVANLPVIGSPLHSPMGDDGGITPMVEVRATLGEEEEEEEEDEMEEGEEDWRAATPIQDDFPSEWSEDRGESAMSAERREQSEESEKKKEENKEASAPSTSRSSTKAVKKVVEVKKAEERPKKERAPLCPPSTAGPKFPVKAKTPSKHQLMMEKLKASMEAEKAEKKKEEKKPRMSFLPPPPPPKSDENALPSMPPPPLRSASTLSSSKTPLKPVSNNSANAPSTSSSISTSSRTAAVSTRKPRVSLLPPPPAAKREEPKEKPKVVVGSAVKSNAARGVPPGSSSSSSAAFPTSSFAPKTTTARRKVDGKAPEPAKRPSISEEAKLARLREAGRTVDVMGVIMNRMMSEKEKRDEKMEKVEREKAESQSRVDQLIHRLNETEKSKRTELEQLHSSNEKAIVSLREDLSRQLEERESQHEGTLTEEKAKFEARIEEMNARHQQKCALLDEKNAESERALEDLMKEKKALQNALATDHDTKVQTLSQEISSLNTALQMKSSEMKELRLKSQHLTMRVDEIPAKDVEITKLKHKINDLKSQLDQKHEREKLLVQQNEELRRKERTSSALTESFRKQVDMLHFQIGLSQEMEKGDAPELDLNSREGGFDQSAYFTPVRLRKNRGESSGDESGSRPYSYTLPSSARMSQSRNSDDSMTRSVVGMFSANRAQTKVAALDRDVIYAPDQIITNVPRKLYSGEEEEDEERAESKGGQADSGIGI